MNLRVCQGLAAGSLATYSTGQKAFAIFCDLHSLDMWAPTEKTLCEFGAWLHGTRKVDGPTVTSYITAVRAALVEAGVQPFDRTDMPRLNRLTKGCARNYAQLYRERKIRLPITLDILRHLSLSIGSVQAYEESLLWAAITLAFGAFLRSDEYTQKTIKATQTVPPHLSSIQFVGNDGVALGDLSRLLRLFERHDSIPSGVEGMSFFVSKSKTDQRMEGHYVFVARSPDPSFCPLLSMLKFLSIRSTLGMSVELGSWLFLKRNREPLQYTDMLGGLRHSLRKLGLNPEEYGTHSLRIGAATLAAHMRVPDAVIQKMGRWNSLCYLRYIRTSVADLLSASSDMFGKSPLSLPDK